MIDFVNGKVFSTKPILNEEDLRRIFLRHILYDQKVMETFQSSHYKLNTLVQNVCDALFINKNGLVEYSLVCSQQGFNDWFKLGMISFKCIQTFFVCCELKSRRKKDLFVKTKKFLLLKCLQ